MSVFFLFTIQLKPSYFNFLIFSPILSPNNFLTGNRQMINIPILYISSTTVSVAHGDRKLKFDITYDILSATVISATLRKIEVSKKYLQNQVLRPVKRTKITAILWVRKKELRYIYNKSFLHIPRARKIPHRFFMLSALASIIFQCMIAAKSIVESIRMTDRLKFENILFCLSSFSILQF